MSEVVIRVEGLGKRYVLGHQRSSRDGLRHVLEAALRAQFRRVRAGGEPKRRPEEEFWALRDVSFDVRQGDTVGVIGRNGAGKSTLLKILSRITEPTCGRIHLKGRLASLLEVGTGFHAELTGRENIYLNGAILGMSRREITRKFDEIVEFAEVSRFLDTPVKRYSSGMYVRLAFSVAAHLEPEILLVDEVLAVGDMAFQRKCLGKMGNAAKEGRTILFVSHNMAAVENLCQKGFVLQHGTLVFGGTAKQAIDHYLHQVDAGADNRGSHVVDLSTARGRPPKFRPLLQRLEFFTDSDQPLKGSLKVGNSLKAYLYFQLEGPTSKLDATLALDSVLGQRIFHANTAFDPNRPQGEWMGDHVLVCDIPSVPLTPGQYKVKVAIDVDNSTVDMVEDAVRLTIVESDYYGTGRIPTTGVVVLKHHWYRA